MVLAVEEGEPRRLVVGLEREGLGVAWPKEMKGGAVLDGRECEAG